MTEHAYLFGNGESCGDWYIEYVMVGATGFDLTEEILLEFFRSIGKEPHLTKYYYGNKEDKRLDYYSIIQGALQKDFQKFLSKNYNLKKVTWNTIW